MIANPGQCIDVRTSVASVAVNTETASKVITDPFSTTAVVGLIPIRFRFRQAVLTCEISID